MRSCLTFCVLSLFCTIAAEAASVRGSAGASPTSLSKQSIQVPKLPTDSPYLTLGMHRSSNLCGSEMYAQFQWCLQVQVPTNCSIPYPPVSVTPAFLSCDKPCNVTGKVLYALRSLCSIKQRILRSEEGSLYAWAAMSETLQSAMQGTQATMSGRGTALWSPSRPGQASSSLAGPRTWSS